MSGQQVIPSMNVTRRLKARKDRKSRQIIFAGEKLDMEAVWKVRDAFFPPKKIVRGTASNSPTFSSIQATQSPLR